MQKAELLPKEKRMYEPWKLHAEKERIKDDKGRTCKKSL